MNEFCWHTKDEILTLKIKWPRKAMIAACKIGDHQTKATARYLWKQMHRESFRRTIKRIQAEQTGKIAVSQ